MPQLLSRTTLRPATLVVIIVSPSSLSSLSQTRPPVGGGVTHAERADSLASSRDSDPDRRRALASRCFDQVYRIALNSVQPDLKTRAAWDEEAEECGPMFGLIALAIATDFFDGKVARWSHTVSEWGKVLDATADKLAAAAVCTALLLRPEEAGPRLPLWFVASSSPATRCSPSAGCSRRCAWGGSRRASGAGRWP